MLAIREKSLGLTHPETAEALGDIATTLVAIGRTTEGMVISQRAIDIWERAETRDPIRFAAALRSRADVLAAGGELPGALESYTKALEITEEVVGGEHSDATDLRVSLAAAALAEGRRDEGWEQALDRRTGGSPIPPDDDQVLARNEKRSPTAPGAPAG